MTFSILKKILIGATSLVLVSATIVIIGYIISFGFHSPIYQDGGLWVRLKSDDTHLSPSMRLALPDSPTAVPGQFSWREIAPGFQIGELTALVNRNVVDQIRLARIDPSRFRFAVCHKSGGLRNVDQWMHTLGAVLVVNGSYFAPGRSNEKKASVVVALCESGVWPTSGSRGFAHRVRIAQRF